MTRKFFLMIGSAILIQALPVQAAPEQKTEKILSHEAYRLVVAQTDFAAHTVDGSRFLELMKNPKAVTLDLRDEIRYYLSHIRGAKHLGPDIHEDQLAKLVPDKHTPILLYCENSLFPTRNVSLTDVALPQILALGYRQVYLLDNPRGNSWPGLPMIENKAGHDAVDDELARYKSETGQKYVHWGTDAALKARILDKLRPKAEKQIK